MERENMQKICDSLLRTLRTTWRGSDIVDIKYDAKKEEAVVLWDNATSRHINVAMDNGLAMIRDIVNHLGI